MAFTCLISSVSSNTWQFFSLSLSVMILTHWPLGVPSDWPLGVPCRAPNFSEYFLISWHKALQIHLLFALPWSRISHYSEDLWFLHCWMVLETRMWELGALMTIRLSLLLGPPKTEIENISKHTNPWTHTFMSIFVPVYLYSYLIKGELILISSLKFMSQDSF